MKNDINLGLTDDDLGTLLIKTLNKISEQNKEIERLNKEISNLKKIEKSQLKEIKDIYKYIDSNKKLDSYISGELNYTCNKGVVADYKGSKSLIDIINEINNTNIKKFNSYSNFIGSLIRALAIAYIPYRTTKMRKEASLIRGNINTACIYRNGRCEICGQYVSDLELHHKIPVSCGGDNSRDNLIWICHSCHKNEHRFNDNYMKMRTLI